MADEPWAISLYEEPLDGLLPFFHMSTGLATAEGVRRLIAVEVARGTQYYAAARDGQVIGMIGVWFDPTGATSELEPPQIIDIAVAPDHRRQGVARALMARAVDEVRAAGYGRLWLYTSGGSPDLLAFYYRLGFRLVSVVPDWFGDGTAKAILRRDL